MTHANAAVAAMGPQSILNPHSVEKDEFFLSYLPLAHIFERSNLIGCFLKGASIGLYHGVITEVCFNQNNDDYNDDDADYNNDDDYDDHNNDD